jgi:hypothetical protein
VVGIQILGNRDEPDPMPLQFLDIVQAIYQRTPEAVQFPDGFLRVQSNPRVASM